MTCVGLRPGCWPPPEFKDLVPKLYSIIEGGWNAYDASIEHVARGNVEYKMPAGPLSAPFAPGREGSEAL